jgi:membrane fusion protein (multidrug efflux system)
MEQELIIKKKSNNVRLIIIIVAVLIGAFFGIRAYLQAQHHETTDNAQLDATLTSVRSAVSGFVVEVRFVENQVVKKGDTLVIIDDKDYKAKVMQARAMLASAESQTGISKSSAQAAQQNASASSINSSALQSNINAAQARLTKSKQELSRIEKMFADGAATQQQLDAARSENQSSNAMYEMAQRQYQAATTQAAGSQSSAKAQQGQISVAGAMVQQRMAELELAETQLKYTVITAPYDGIVSKKNVEVGQLIQYGQPLCSAVEISNLWVTANFKETQMNNIRVGQKVSIKLDAYENLKLTGTVESVSGGTGAKFSLLPPDNATGNFVKVTQRVPIRIKLDKTSEKNYYLTPGLSAFVDVEIN